jgi:hypothetical protein
MSGLTGYRPVPVRRAGGPMPGAMVFAVVCGVGVVILWASAALVQAIAVSVVLFGLMGAAPFVPWAVGLFVAYAGLQFLPSSHRWYHPKPHVPGSPVPVPGVCS